MSATNRGAAGLVSFIRGVPAHEAPLLIALREMVGSADAEGRVSRERLIGGFRRAYVTRFESVRDADGTRVRRLNEIRRMSSEEIDGYLQDQFIARMEAQGWVAAQDGPEARRLVFTAPLWFEVASRRRDVLELLDREITRRLVPASTDAVPHVPGSSQLAARALVKVYRKRRVVDRVDLELRQGEIVGLLGPNGAGKTTTFYMIVGLIPPDAGEVRLDDDDLTDVSMYKRARRGIGYLAQEPSVFRKLTVEQNVLAILETLPLSRDERRERLETLLDELSIKHLRKSRAYSLSGGERRRLEITRALVRSPKFMLLDEPFAGIDPIAVDDIQRIVAGLKERGLGVLITDHNVRETLSITDRAYIMFDGRIHLEGTSEELVSDPQARKLYLGEDFRL